MEKWKLSEYIDYMLKGGGWKIPVYPPTIGRILKIIKEEEKLDDNVEIEVEYTTSHEGWGPSFRYLYFWTVKFPKEIKFESGIYRSKEHAKIDEVFGGFSGVQVDIQGNMVKFFAKG